MFDQSILVSLGFILIFAGFTLAFLAILLLFLKGMRLRGKTRGGGVIMIGPIPIIFGTDKGSVKALIILALVLMIFVLVLTLLSSNIL